MSRYAFQQSLFVTQHYFTPRRDGFLAQRWEDEGGCIFVLPVAEDNGFFVQVGLDETKGQLRILRSFNDSGLLED